MVELYFAYLERASSADLRDIRLAFLPAFPIVPGRFPVRDESREVYHPGRLIRGVIYRC
jgi:hypothetical protein